jgi:hypothetical protein
MISKSIMQSLEQAGAVRLAKPAKPERPERAAPSEIQVIAESHRAALQAVKEATVKAIQDGAELQARALRGAVEVLAAKSRTAPAAYSLVVQRAPNGLIESVVARPLGGGA